MNFLALCQRAATECGVSGTITTTAGQAGSLARIVSWVGDSWNDIQCAHDDWIWMRASNILGSGISITPAAAQYNIPLGTGAGQVGVAVDSFGMWCQDTFRCYTAANAGGTLDEIFLEPLPFDAWRDSYMLGAQRQVQTRPVVFAVGPDQSLNIGPPSNGLYTITGDYIMAPGVMVNDTDLPVGLPTRFHNLVVYGAMKKYGYYEAASDVIQRATVEWQSTMRQLEKGRLPDMTWGSSLA